MVLECRFGLKHSAIASIKRLEAGTSSMELPPAVVVHGLDDARVALGLRRPVTLLSGRGAAGYAGVGWWRALVAASGTKGPDVLDCDDAPGRAMEALRAGCRLIVLHPAVSAFGLVVDRAASVGATVLQVRPAAFDAGPGGLRPRALQALTAWVTVCGS